LAIFAQLLDEPGGVRLQSEVAETYHNGNLSMNHGHANQYVRLWPWLPWQPPDAADEETQVIHRQVWKLDDFKAIAQIQIKQGGSRIRPITDDCVKDIQKLALSPDDLAALILQLEDRDYVKSIWCARGQLEGIRLADAQIWLPCDAYVLKRRERMPSGWEGIVEYYVKLCMTPTQTVVLLVSLHL
jgi:hypothetical protein